MKMIEPSFQLRLLIGNEDMFITSFGSLEDLLNDTVWLKACTFLHEQIKKWVNEND